MAQEVSYSQYQLWNDAMFLGRVASVLKNEGFCPAGENPMMTAQRYAADVASEPGLAASYHSAMIADPPVKDPGAANDVITDGVLLSAVTAVMNRVPRRY